VADAEKRLSADEHVRRSVRRTLGNWLLLILLVAALGIWGSLGAFTLQPGQAAVMLLLGRHVETIDQDGFHLRLPPPLMSRTIVNVAELRNLDFGFRGAQTPDTPPEKVSEATMQTGDNNIMLVSFAVQYTIADPFLERFRLEDPDSVVRDAAQAAMREVVGRMNVDDVLRGRRALVASETSRLLQDILDSYEAGLDVQGVQLQEVNPPEPVRAAFDDVVAANQDADRQVNEAEGYRNEVLPKARAQAVELRESARGYKEAKIAEATGEGERFKAVAAEYRKAPEVTQKRLYLETMEKVLPQVEKVIIEKGTTQVLPYLPLERHGAGEK
jgi:membrane protease subunit HflK